MTAPSSGPAAALLEPLPIGRCTAPSRVLFGPHVTNLARGRALSDRHVAYYARRAAGGCGVVVTETASAHDSDWPYERAPLATACREGWSQTARACRAAGAVVVASIGHAGGQGSSAWTRAALWAPSGVAEVNAREMPKVMEPEDVDAVVRGFGTAALLAVEAGLDGVEVNGGQASLVRQFLSGLTNMRGDAWGADRLLFAREVLAAVRAAVGDTIVGLRLCVDELAPWAGITPESAIPIAQELAPLVDYLVLVRGSIYSAAATHPDGHEEPGFNLAAAAAVRAALAGAAPVLAQGSIVDPRMAAAAIAAGSVDGVEMTRAQIADGELVRKLAERRAREVRPCILCNQACQVLDGRNPIVSCVGDPRSGHETEDPALDGPAQAPLDIRVVGGGPCGLEAARVAAQRGHRVTLLEARDRAGGRLRTAALAPGRERLASLADWLEGECRRLGVEVRLGTTATATDAGTATILCTGSIDGDPAYAVDASPGAPAILSAAALHDHVGAGAALPEGAAVVWDPLGGPIGIAAAELLAARGIATTLVTPDHVVGTLLSLTGDLVAANARLRRAGVEIARRALVRAVRPAGVEVEDRFGGGTRLLPAALLVDAGPRLPDPGPGIPGAVRAGDAVAPRTVLEAVLEGRRAVLALEDRASESRGGAGGRDALEPAAAGGRA